MINTEFTLPVSVKVQPADWNFSVLLGSEPSISFIRTAYTGTPSTSVTTNTAVDGTNAAVEPDPVGNPGDETIITRTGSEETYNYSEWTWDASADYRIGLNMMLPQGIMLDASLNLSGGITGSILEFRDFVIQTTVPLP